ncbi:MAG: (2Fe-2S)-binding protein [Deltaproteobacteria bacterium]|nr:(2Fe-2S)-binding protein [Deltaproteobacteria bacterium]
MKTRERAMIRVRVNGVEYEREVEPRLLLCDFLRENLGLTGTHIGCEHGICGSCTVMVNGYTVRSCLMFAVQANDADVTTVEGLAAGGKLHPLQEAFSEHYGLQCGFCTPGMLFSALELLKETPKPTDHEIREGIAGNICRCTGYYHIVQAVKAAAEQMAQKQT